MIFLTGENIGLKIWSFDENYFYKAVKVYQGHGQFLSIDGMHYYFLVPGLLCE
jgi:hypothetical protein